MGEKIFVNPPCKDFSNNEFLKSVNVLKFPLSTCHLFGVICPLCILIYHFTKSVNIYYRKTNRADNKKELKFYLTYHSNNINLNYNYN